MLRFPKGKVFLALARKRCSSPGKGGKGGKERGEKINEQETKGELGWVSFQALLKTQIMKPRVKGVDQ